jgi:SAM-dependent methyltransferase
VSGVFDDAQAQTLIASDTEHWWFRSKASFVSSLIQQNLGPGLSQGMLVDLGAGAGGVSSLLGWRPDRVVALDGSNASAVVAQRRHGLLATVGEGSRVPLANEVATVVTLLDVLEHLDRPDSTLAEAWRILKGDGRLIVSVPAHQWLWSGADDFLGHARRYNRPLLRQELTESGFRSLFMSHVFSWLVVPVWIRRRTTANPERQLGLVQGPPLVAGAARLLTAMEQRLIKRASLPFGTSIVCVAAKGWGVGASS